MGRRRRSRGIKDMLVKCDGRLKKLQNSNGGIEEKKKAFCRREKGSGVALSLSFMENLRMERNKLGINFKKQCFNKNISDIIWVNNIYK